MLTAADLAGLLERVVYRPGWSISAYETPAQSLWVAIDAELPDSYDPDGGLVPLRVKSPIPTPALVDEQAFLEWLRWRLETVEVHECHEWLRWRATGRPLFDPHADGADEPKES